MSILIAILGLSLLVLVHEAGHFVVSLALRMRPRKFYVGFPPPVLKTTRGGIEYGIGAVPLGGFVKIPGMHRPLPEDVHLERAIQEAPGLQGPVERLKHALAIDDHPLAGETVEELRQSLRQRHLSPAGLASAERTLTDLDDALGADAYWRAPTWKRVAVIAAGPLANVVLTVVLLIALLMSTGGKVTTRVDEVKQGLPAAHAGLRPGDRIVAIDGTPVTPEQISRRIAGSHGRPLTVTVDRGGARVVLGPVSPERSEDDGVYRLGFVLHGEGLSFLPATTSAFRVTGDVTREIVASLGRIVTGGGRKDISSPVGIVHGSSEAVKQGTDSYLWVLALISLSIALLNLLPLLPLDGGHIAFAVAEGIRGRSVAREVYERLSVVGIALVLLLFVIGLSNDIGRLS
jgi:regulator of sigma E protease